MLSVGGAYIFGIFLVYTLIGLGILQVLSFFNITHGFAKFAAALLLALGAINIIGYLKPALSLDMGIAGFIKPTMAKLIKGGSIPLVFLLGGLVALFEFPCTGGPYLLVLGLLHDSRTFIQGLWYLVLYNIIFILPLVAILFTATQPAVLNRFDALRHQHQAKAKLIVGAVMVVLSLIILLFY
jgi:cytochrome c biogenesis protein CcdA